jgi:hypothetical protein
MPQSAAESSQANQKQVRNCIQQQSEAANPIVPEASHVICVGILGFSTRN